MYFPIGWPKVLKSLGNDNQIIRQIVSNRDKILFASLSDDCLVVWFCKVCKYEFCVVKDPMCVAAKNMLTSYWLFQPTVPIVYHRRNEESLQRLGVNVGVEWKPDSSMLCISVTYYF